MTFDFHIHIDDQSLEGYALESIVNTEHISPEEAVRRALRHIADAKTKTPAEEMWGAFSSDEDSAIIDQAMDHVRVLRQSDRLRDFGT